MSSARPRPLGLPTVPPSPTATTVEPTAAADVGGHDAWPLLTPTLDPNAAELSRSAWLALARASALVPEGIRARAAAASPPGVSSGSHGHLAAPVRERWQAMKSVVPTRQAL